MRVCFVCVCVSSRARQRVREREYASALTSSSLAEERRKMPNGGGIDQQLHWSNLINRFCHGGVGEIFPRLCRYHTAVLWQTPRKAGHKNGSYRPFVPLKRFLPSFLFSSVAPALNSECCYCFLALETTPRSQQPTILFVVVIVFK